jgi:hypothetical protein
MANKVKQPKIAERETLSPGRMHSYNGDGLVASCWCEYEFVIVSDKEVANGLTRSCGTAKCETMHEAYGGVKYGNSN